MYYAPRTIAFLCELLHPPLAPDPQPIQRVHNRLFEAGSPPYQSFNVTPEGTVLSNPVTRPGSVSSASFLKDRFQFREELTGETTEAFAERIKSLTTQVCQERQIQIFTAQVVTVRTLINPKNFRDSRGFLKEGMFKFDGELQALGRDPQLFGMRLVFPPTQDSPNAFTLRVESFASDSRSLFIENQGSFGPQVVARGLDELAANVETCYAFIVDRVLPFLGNFDVRQEA